MAPESMTAAIASGLPLDRRLGQFFATDLDDFQHWPDELENDGGAGDKDDDDRDCFGVIDEEVHVPFLKLTMTTIARRPLSSFLA